MEKIPLTNLEVIRGNHTYRIQGEEYALVVALTSRDTTPVMGLRHLHMPKLKGGSLAMGIVTGSLVPACT